MENRIGDLMQVTMSKLKEMVDVNTVVGEPIETPDGITLVPVSRVSFGLASGGGEYGKETAHFGGGNGAGAKIEPIGFLVIRNGNVRMLNITPPAATTVDRLLELLPQLIDRVDEFVEKRQEKKNQEF